MLRAHRSPRYVRGDDQREAASDLLIRPLADATDSRTTRRPFPCDALRVSDLHGNTSFLDAAALVLEAGILDAHDRVLAGVGHRD